MTLEGLLCHLASLTLQTVRFEGAEPVCLLSRPTSIQAAACEALGLSTNDLPSSLFHASAHTRASRDRRAEPSPSKRT
jgi:hypothetical protein